MWLVQDFYEWNPQPFPGLDINVKQGLRGIRTVGLLYVVPDFLHQQ